MVGFLVIDNRRHLGTCVQFQLIPNVFAIFRLKVVGKSLEPIDLKMVSDYLDRKEFNTISTRVTSY